MNRHEFVDYYELLQLNTNADTETIEHTFRYLAKRFHPDNSETADTDRFRQIVDAHKTLTDPVARAGYDVRHQEYWDQKWGLASEASNKSGFSDDQVIREHLLSLLYVQRRRSVKNAGMGEAEIARLIKSPYELVEFHMWYLKSKGWAERLDNGQVAITATGVDKVERSLNRISPNLLLDDRRDHAREPAENGEELNLLRAE